MKRTSKRRWKARCRIGREIPAVAIANHRLDRWFIFTWASMNKDTYYATRKV